MRAPLQTRICGTLAAGLIAGVLAWGGPAPKDDVRSPQTRSSASSAAAAGIAGTRQQSTGVPVLPVTVPLRATLPPPAPADPDRIGSCPKQHSPVVWQGLLDGRPTWKHRDGSITQRARQKITTQEGEVLEVPVIVSMRPAATLGAR